MGVCDAPKRNRKDTSNCSNKTYKNNISINQSSIGNNYNNNINDKNKNDNCVEENKENDNIIKIIFDKHNRFRQISELGPLNLNDELCQLAQKYAEKCAETQSLDHCPFLYNDDIIGENIQEIENEKDIPKICDEWFEEKIHFNNKEYKNKARHVSQILDNKTKEVGFGFSSSPNGKTYFVAYYYPAAAYD